MPGMKFLLYGAAFGFIVMLLFNPFGSFDGTGGYDNQVYMFSIDTKDISHDWERLEGGFGNSYGNGGASLYRQVTDNPGGH